MTEPEAMAYTINHFKNNDKSATQMRGIIFEKYAEREDPWIVSEDCLMTYGIEADKSKEYADQWWLISAISCLRSEGEWTTTWNIA